MGRKLSGRPDFAAVQASEVLDPARLPTVYSWMRPGTYAVYHNVQQDDNTSQPPTDWGWEIDYVNGRSRDGLPSAMGYTLFMASEGGKHIQSWLNWPTLFVGFHTSPRPGIQDVEVGGQLYSCFKEERDREGGMGVKKHLWYEPATCLLLRMDVQIVGDGPMIYKCILGDSNALPRSKRTVPHSLGGTERVAEGPSWIKRWWK